MLKSSLNNDELMPKWSLLTIWVLPLTEFTMLTTIVINLNKWISHYIIISKFSVKPIKKH